MIHKYTTVILCNVYTTVTKNRQKKAPAMLAGAAVIHLMFSTSSPSVSV